MSASRLKVLYVAEFVTGGSVESLHSLVSGLDRSVYDPTVLFYKQPTPDIRRRFEEAGAAIAVLFPDAPSGDTGSESAGFNLQTRIRRLFGRHVEGLYAALKYLYSFLRYKQGTYRALRREFSNRQLDIVHLNNGLASDMPGILAARRCRLPIICHVRAFAQLTRVHIWASHFVSQFLCVSTAIREYVIAAGVEPARTSVCHDSVNQQRFRKTPVDREHVLDEFGWSNADKVFAIIGRLDSWKGHETFIDAISIARRSNPAIRGLIVGDITPSATNQAYVASLHQQVGRLELGSGVAFAGHRSDVPEIIQCLDGVVCASSSPEPFGLMVVESMAVEVPVIATDAGGPVDMITDGEDGLLVPLQDADAMAAAMVSIANDEQLANRIAEAGNRTVNARFTVAHHVNNVCNAYDSVMSGN